MSAATHATATRAPEAARAKAEPGGDCACNAEAAPEAGLPRFLAGVQPKLEVGAPGDALEREAEAVAGAVTRGEPVQPIRPAATAPRFQRLCASCAEKLVEAEGTPPDSPGLIQRLAGDPGSAAPAASDTVSGLPAALRRRLEDSLGADLGGVRVHTGPTAHGLARELGARAFTHGQHIWLGARQQADDLGLMAHEVTHVLQQTGAAAGGSPPAVAEHRPGEDEEALAEQSRARLQEGSGDDGGDDASDDGGASPSGAGAAGDGDPGDGGGRGLLAHELTHTLQQRGPVSPRVQRQPDAPKPAQARPPTAAEAQAAAPPAWTDYFDEVVPAILEAAEGNDKVGLQRALWLIIQAYGEQSPGVAGPPSGHRNRLFNEQGAVTREGGKITGVVPGQESEGVYLYNLPQNESPEKGKTDIKSSPTFGYDTPERATTHHLEQMQKRWGGAWNALTQEKGSFENFAHALKAAGYAKAQTYDTDLIALQGQVRSQVAAWLKYRVPEMRARLPQMEEYLQFLRDTRDRWAQRAAEEPDPVGEIKTELARMNGLVQGMESQLTEVRARLGRLERFAAVLGVKLPAAAR